MFLLVEGLVFTLMSGHICKNAEYETERQKNAGQKNEDQQRVNRHFSASHFSAYRAWPGWRTRFQKCVLTSGYSPQKSQKLVERIFTP
jgi:hypothetical protein